MFLAGLVTACMATLALAQDKVASRPCYHHHHKGGSVYDYQEEDLFRTRNISLSEYRGNVSVVDNIITN